MSGFWFLSGATTALTVHMQMKDPERPWWMLLIPAVFFGFLGAVAAGKWIP